MSEGQPFDAVVWDHGPRTRVTAENVGHRVDVGLLFERRRLEHETGVRALWLGVLEQGVHDLLRATTGPAALAFLRTAHAAWICDELDLPYDRVCRYLDEHAGVPLVAPARPAALRPAMLVPLLSRLPRAVVPPQPVTRQCLGCATVFTTRCHKRRWCKETCWNRYGRKKGKAA